MKSKELESALDKLNRADRLECTADLTFEEARAILKRISELEERLEDDWYEKSTRD